MLELYSIHDARSRRRDVARPSVHMAHMRLRDATDAGAPGAIHPVASMWLARTLLLLRLLRNSAASATPSRRSVTVTYDASLRPAAYGTERLRGALLRAGADVRITTAPPIVPGSADIVVALQQESADVGPHVGSGRFIEGAFAIERWNGTKATKLHVAAVDAAGAMYACLELTERLETYMLDRDELVWEDFVDSMPLPLDIAPRFEYRALKFNLPWSAYRPGNATVENYNLCRNLTFWTSFLDMMAENRYNVITLWALHPWPCV